MNIGSVIKPITRNNCSHVAVEFKEVSSAWPFDSGWRIVYDIVRMRDIFDYAMNQEWPISDVNFSTGDGKLGITTSAKAAVGAEPVANPWITMLQAHVEVDSMGSREIASK